MSPIRTRRRPSSSTESPESRRETYPIRVLLLVRRSFRSFPVRADRAKTEPTCEFSRIARPVSEGPGGVIVGFRQHKRDEADFDDNGATGRSQTEDAVDKRTEEYFGEDVDTFDAEPRESSSTGASRASSAVGQTIQSRMGGIQFLELAEVVEIQMRIPGTGGRGEGVQGGVAARERNQGERGAYLAVSSSVIALRC